MPSSQETLEFKLQRNFFHASKTVNFLKKKQNEATTLESELHDKIQLYCDLISAIADARATGDTRSFHSPEFKRKFLQLTLQINELNNQYAQVLTKCNELINFFNEISKEIETESNEYEKLTSEKVTDNLIASLEKRYDLKDLNPMNFKRHEIPLAIDLGAVAKHALNKTSFAKIPGMHGQNALTKPSPISNKAFDAIFSTNRPSATPMPPSRAVAASSTRPVVASSNKKPSVKGGNVSQLTAFFSSLGQAAASTSHFKKPPSGGKSSAAASSQPTPEITLRKLFSDTTTVMAQHKEKRTIAHELESALHEKVKLYYDIVSASADTRAAGYNYTADFKPSFFKLANEINTLNNQLNKTFTELNTLSTSLYRISDEMQTQLERYESHTSKKETDNLISSLAKEYDLKKPKKANYIQHKTLPAIDLRAIAQLALNKTSLIELPRMSGAPTSLSDRDFLAIFKTHKPPFRPLATGRQVPLPGKAAATARPLPTPPGKAIENKNNTTKLTKRKPGSGGG